MRANGKICRRFPRRGLGEPGPRAADEVDLGVAAGETPTVMRDARWLV